MPKTLHFFTDGAGVKSIDLPQYPDAAWNWITGKPDDTSDESLYSRVAAVYRCANLTADAVSNIPFVVYKGETEFDRSNDWQNKVGFMNRPRELLRLWRLSLFMTNTAYGFMEGNRAIKNLRYLVPTTITPVVDKREGLTGFKRQLGTESSFYSLEDNRIFYMLRLDHTTEILPSRNTEFRALLNAAGVLYYADYYVQSFFQRGGIKPALLSVAGVPTPKERERIESVWDKVLHGWSKYMGKVISSETMDVKVIGEGIDNLKDAALHDSKIQDIAMAAGMPLSLLLANSANYATAKTEYNTWFRDSVMPWAFWMQENMNDLLFKPLGLRFEFQPEMTEQGQEEERQRAQAYVSYVSAKMMPSKAAQILGIDLPAGIEYEDLDADFMELSTISSPLAIKPPDTMEPEEQAEQESTIEDMEEAAEKSSVTTLTIQQLRELELWQDMAFRKLKQKKDLDFPFVCKTIPEEIACKIRDRLPDCRNERDIENTFQMSHREDDAIKQLADALNKAVERVNA